LPKNEISLLSLFWTFLKVGSTAFGGFMALISVVQSLVVERRRLLRQEDMLDGISLASMLPGPVAVNVVAYVGYRLRGVTGALVAATAVILPSFLLITTLSYVYFRWGQMPAMQKLFMGFIPAVTAIIATTAWGMSVKAI
jgi:chromate transporter